MGPQIAIAVKIRMLAIARSLLVCGLEEID